MKNIDLRETVYLSITPANYLSPSLEWLPDEMHVLEVLQCKNVPMTSLKGFPKLTPKLTEIDLLGTKITSLEGLPAEIPSLKYFYWIDSEFATLDNFPKQVSNLELIRINNCKLSSLTTLPSNLPKINQIDVNNNALTSLQGLPPVIHNPPSSILIDVRNNCLENFAGLPYIHFHGGFKHYVQDMFACPQLLFQGNPLRSLHGVPRQIIHEFCSYSHNSDFHFSSIGSTLLQTCNAENDKYWIQFEDLEWGEEYEELQMNFRPESAHPSWHRAHDALFEYYRLSSLELAHQYILHCTSGPDMPDNMIERLKHEGGASERFVLEQNLPNPQEDLVILTIQARLSVKI